MKINRPSFLKWFISSMLLFLFFGSFAQPTQEELAKMVKQAEQQMKQYGNDTAAMMNNLLGQQKMIQAAMQKSHGANQSAGLSMGDYSNADNWKFPAKDVKRLSSLSAKTYSKKELQAFLVTVYSQISQHFSAGINTSVKSITAKYNNDPVLMGNAAVTGWYENYREEALLLIVKAASGSDNGLLLNNAAALLNMSGLEEKAIPVLKNLLSSFPSSAMVLNNLGQAYAGLGELDTAMYYLGRCIRIEPENPEANNTAGQISVVKGNKDAAAEFFKQSIKGAYSKTAAIKLKRIRPEEKISALRKPHIKIPEYFNEFKYKLPPQVSSVNNAITNSAEQRALSEILNLQTNSYAASMRSVGMRVSHASGRAVQKGEFMAQPYYEFCGIMANELYEKYMDEVAILGSTTTKVYNEKRMQMRADYEKKLTLLKRIYDSTELKCCNGEKSGGCCIAWEVKCRAYNDLGNAYLAQFAPMTEEWQKKNLLIYSTYFDQIIYWSYLSQHPMGDDVFRAQTFYPMVLNYLNMISMINYTEVIYPCKNDPIKKSADSNKIKEVDCPMDVSIPLGVGKIEFNCDRFAMSSGEGLVFGYEKNFKTRQSTLSVGAGLQAEFAVKAGPLKAGVSADATESFFICFDGDNKVSDLGVKNAVSATAEAPGIGKAETGISSTLGVNSGWNFEEGPFKGLIP